MYREVDQTAKINMVFFYCTLHWAVPGYQDNRSSGENHASVQWKNLAPPPPPLSVAANLTLWEDGVSRDQRLQRTPFMLSIVHFFQISPFPVSSCSPKAPQLAAVWESNTRGWGGGRGGHGRHHRAGLAKRGQRYDAAMTGTWLRGSGIDQLLERFSGC